MKKRWKSLACIIIAAAAIMTCSLLAACSGTDGVIDVPAPEVKVETLTVIKAAKKLTYLECETFNTRGMAMKAALSDGTTKTVLGTTEGFSFSPKRALYKEDDEIRLTYRGVTVIQPITVVELTEMEIDRTAIPDRVPTGKTDLSGLIVKGKDPDGEEIIIDEYIVTLDGEEVTDLSAVPLTSGKHTVTVIRGKANDSFEIEAFNGYIVEADTLILTKNIGSDDKNFVEAIGIDEIVHGTTIRVVSNASEPASGGKYLGDLKKGAKFAFHIWSDVDAVADITLTASSGYMTKGKGWTPLEMSDMRFNKLFSIKIGTKDNMRDLSVSDSVILPGGKTDKADGDPMLWVNWKEVIFGEIALKEGDNIIEFTVTSDYKNSQNASCACNIDKIEVEFKN